MLQSVKDKVRQLGLPDPPIGLAGLGRRELPQDVTSTGRALRRNSGDLPCSFPAPLQPSTRLPCAEKQRCYPPAHAALTPVDLSAQWRLRGGSPCGGSPALPHTRPDRRCRAYLEATSRPESGRRCDTGGLKLLSSSPPSRRQASGRRDGRREWRA